ncbi:DUF1573 domain-containing protein [Membranicola marinus]|uniref:DUF1573 domain-containing protein n=1 Tax=Membranihabitans marinus TaxID=1227546 RepID=A0A953HPE3_9BACT|nr:DUF1573 domain-containing protein [Membranihabitans marinus]MBY5959754.1 DUF1573 domain-containing protein [Membranihabitans marinus]
MKHIVLTLLLAVGCLSFGLAQNKSTPDEQKTSLKFEKTTVDYGTIEKGSDPYRSFVFENASDEPVAIKSAKGSCGCTVPEYPKEPIMPGQKSEVKVRYDTQRVGPFGKTVTLMTTKDEKIVLTIKGKVYKAEDKSVPAQDQAAF